MGTPVRVRCSLANRSDALAPLLVASPESGPPRRRISRRGSPAVPLARDQLMEKVVALAKRRGFIFPSSEIYGGVSGFYDYGPYGVALKRAVRDLWWRHMVDLRDDVVG